MILRWLVVSLLLANPLTVWSYAAIVRHHHLPQTNQKRRLAQRSIPSLFAQWEDGDFEDDNVPEVIPGVVDNFVRDAKWEERSKQWVVLVDDEASIRQAVGQLLFDRGYRVTACPDAPTALQVIRQGRRQNVDDDSGQSLLLPNAIVSDIRMPGEMDGLAFLQVLRNDPDLLQIPVVLLTAKGMTQDRIAGYQAGADIYLPKPFDPDELVSAIDSLIERHNLLNGQTIQVEDLKKDLDEIKYMLLEKGGGGVGGGWVKANVFLTPDERAILELLCEGYMNKEIAAKSFLSTRRVEQLLTSMFRKTGVKNRTELVRWAVSTGTVQL